MQPGEERIMQDQVEQLPAGLDALYVVVIARTLGIEQRLVMRQQNMPKFGQEAVRGIGHADMVPLPRGCGSGNRGPARHGSRRSWDLPAPPAEQAHSPDMWADRL